MVLLPQCLWDHGDDLATIRECIEMATNANYIHLDKKEVQYLLRYHWDIIIVVGD